MLHSEENDEALSWPAVYFVGPSKDLEQSKSGTEIADDSYSVSEVCSQFGQFLKIRFMQPKPIVTEPPEMLTIYF